MFKQRQHYRDFLAAGEGISTNILADRLLRLEEAGVISKQQDPNHGKRYIYRLTDKGVELLPVLMKMMLWAAEFDHETEMSKGFIRELRKDPAALETRIRASLAE